MRKPKHTDMPWVAERNAMGELAIFTITGKHTLSGEGAKPLPFKQREANAQLQAAAPELLALADHVLAMADDAYLMGHPEWVEIAKEARATKAKAGGKS